jgi:PAS domain S-box-containing protein
LRQQAEAELQASEERFRMLFDQAPLGYQSLDEDGNFIDVNRAWLDLLGYKREEVLGRWFGDLLTPAFVEGFRKRFLLFKTAGQIYSEFEMLHKNGNRLFIAFEGRIGHKINGEFKQTHCILQDIAERKRAEQELLEKEIQYRNLADSGLALIWTSGTDKLCNYFNEPWLKFTGRTLQQEMGNGWTEGVHPDDFDRCLETYITAFDKHEPFDMEYRLRHASGEYRWLQDLGTPNYNSAGEFIGYIGHCFDITERKQAEDDLRRSEENLTITLNYITKPVSTPIVRARVKTHLALHDQNRLLEERVRERTEELAHAQAVAYIGYAALAEFRDRETGTHILRTQQYVRILAHYLLIHPRFQGYLGTEEIDLLRRSAPLHDWQNRCSRPYPAETVHFQRFV